QATTDTAWLVVYYFPSTCEHSTTRCSEILKEILATIESCIQSHDELPPDPIQLGSVDCDHNEDLCLDQSTQQKDLFIGLHYHNMFTKVLKKILWEFNAGQTQTLSQQLVKLLMTHIEGATIRITDHSYAATLLNSSSPWMVMFSQPLEHCARCKH